MSISEIITPIDSTFVNLSNLYFKLQKSLKNINDEQKLYKYSISSLIKFATADIENILDYYSSNEVVSNIHADITNVLLLEKHITERLAYIKEYFASVMLKLEQHLTNNPPNINSLTALHEWDEKAKKFAEDVCFETMSLLINEENPYANDVLYAAHGFKLLDDYITKRGITDIDIGSETCLLIEQFVKLTELFD